jgi:serine/threonine-protein kinase
MSPEQREGRPATVQSDLYGVGAILCEMLTGERPDGGAHASPRMRPSGAHRDLDTRHDEAVLALLEEDPARRPPDAFAARRTLTALSWPSVVEPAAPRPVPRAASERPARMRVEMQLDGRAIDTWLGRAVERVPLTDVTLARAAAFARAESTSLQLVLRVDRELDEIWLEPARGRPLEGPLSGAQLEQARAALDALHAAGAVHGAIDAEHLLIDGAGTLTLRFAPEADPTATVDRDRLALARLAVTPAYT